jgi:hypothetical protein
MFILEEPYVSDLLVAAVAELRAPVLRTSMAERRLEGAAAGDGRPAGDLLVDDAAFALAARRPGARLYTNSENALDWVGAHLSGTDLPRQARLFKDKLAFRDLLADLYPGYRYTGVRLDELRAFDPASLPAPFVVKPAVGFFSLGVHVVADAGEWPAVAKLLEAEAGAVRGLYPTQVLDVERFVVEQVIPGEEFAVDAYFDATGSPVLVNVYAHLFAGPDDVSDRVYLTDTDTVERLGPPALEFLSELGRRARLRDVPVHAELRVDESGAVAPIEVNPLRFGGWCATDLAHFAYGIDPYRCYLRDERPDWAAIASATRGRTTAIVVADLPAALDRASIGSVDYERFAARFSQVLELRPTDFRRYPVFAFTFVQVPSDDLSELHAVLGADLREYLRPR